MAVIMRSNDALGQNPPAGNEVFGTHGSDWLWTITAVYALSFILFFAASFRPKAGERIFHYIFTVTLLVGTIAYFAMASDIGFKVVEVVNHKPTTLWTREILWAKYVFWVVEFPAVILSLGLLSGISWATIIYNIFLSWIWVISYLISAFTSTSNYKWGFYAFGTIAYLILAFNTFFYGHRSANRLSVGRDHILLAGWVNLLWLLYPIAFGCSDGGNRIGVTQGQTWFGVLDILLTPVIAFATLFLARRWDYGNLNLEFTRYGRVRHAGTYPEKAEATPATAPAATA